MKKDQEQTNDAERRNFLRSSATTGLGIMAATALPAAVVAGTVTAEQKGNQGYQLTQHILDYYETLAN